MSLAGMLAMTLLVFSIVAPDRVAVPRDDGADGRPLGRRHQGRPGGPGVGPGRSSLAVRPFLLLSTRAEDEAAEGEYEAFLRVTGLPPSRLRRVRTEAAPLPSFELDDYAGIFVGGGPFNSSDAPLQKSAVQHRVERELAALLDEVVARDYPFFGAC